MGRMKELLYEHDENWQICQRTHSNHGRTGVKLTNIG